MQVVDFNLNIDMREVHAFDPQLHSQLMDFPMEAVGLMDKEANMLYAELRGEEYTLRLEVRACPAGETSVIWNVHWHVKMHC